MPANSPPKAASAKVLEIELDATEIFVDVAPNHPVAAPQARPPGGEPRGRFEDARPQPQPRGPAGGPTRPGRDMRPDEAARAGAVNPGRAFFEGARAFAESLGNLQDEISLEQALAFSRRPRRAPTTSFAEPTMVDRRPEAERIAAPTDLDQAEMAPGVPNLPAVVEQRCLPGLPAIIGRNVFVPNRELANLATPEIRWTQLYDLPGYFVTQIRGVGRSILRRQPCFLRHEQACAAAGEDPLGAVRVLANLGGNGPNTLEELDTMAQWIRANGTATDAARMVFDNMPDYAPRIVVACDENNSYMLVQERVADGCVIDADYIYTWEGGLAFYRDNAQAIATQIALVDGTAPVLHVHVAPPPGMAQARALPPRRPQAARPAPALPPPPAARAEIPAAGRLIPPPAPRAPLPDALLKAAPSRERILALQVAPPGASMSESLAQLRSRGFKPFGTPDGPTMRLVLDDGRRVEVYGEKGRPLAASATLRARIVEDGFTVSDEALDTASDIDAVIAAPDAMSP